MGQVFPSTGENLITEMYYSGDQDGHFFIGSLHSVTYSICPEKDPLVDTVLGYFFKTPYGLPVRNLCCCGITGLLDVHLSQGAEYVCVKVVDHLK